jgi:F0F1-type ATP synthase membrane subunit c/vacuolar-type H+-ATPase subunit K
LGTSVGLGAAVGGTGVAVGAGAQDAITAPAAVSTLARRKSRRVNLLLIFLLLEQMKWIEHE